MADFAYLVDPHGEIVRTRTSDVAALLNAGYSLTDDSGEKLFRHRVELQREYGGMGSAIGAGVEGALDALTLGASTWIEQGLGFDPEGIKAREELHPIAHGIGTGALFIIVGALQERMHTRDMQRMGGLWTTMPRMAALGLFFAIAALGLPGMGSFVGEFLVLLGAYRASTGLTAVATMGLIAAVVYALILVQKTFHGENTHAWRLRDSSIRETMTLGAMVAVSIWLGLYPQPVLDAAAPAVRNVREITSRFGRVWRDAVQGAPERRVASHTSEGQRSNAPSGHGTNREVIPRTFLNSSYPRAIPYSPMLASSLSARCFVRSSLQESAYNPSAVPPPAPILPSNAHAALR